MWFQLYSTPEQSAFFLIFCMSMTRLLSECQMLYTWDYDQSNENSEPDINLGAYADSPFEIGAENKPVFGFDQAKQMTRNPGRTITEARLGPKDTWLLRERLKGLYAILKQHPALMDRRLQVGSHRPHIPPHYTQQPYEGRNQQSYKKRSFSHMWSSPVCPSRTGWRLLRVARDINDTQVEVFQPSAGSDGHQWFFTTTCDNDYTSLNNAPDCPRCCRGINKHRYHSYCMTKKSFVMALVRKSRDQPYDWNWIQIDSSCTCSISPA